MAYTDVALLAADYDFQQRVSACVAIETLDDTGAVNPPAWAAEHAWQMAAQPGFGDAYASALAADPPVERPGQDPGVISDSQILGAVQALANPPADPDPVP